MSGPGWWRRPARRRAPAARPPAAHVRVIHPTPEPEPAPEPERDDRQALPGWANADGCPCTICTPPEIA